MTPHPHPNSMLPCFQPMCLWTNASQRWLGEGGGGGCCTSSILVLLKRDSTNLRTFSGESLGHFAQHFSMEREILYPQLTLLCWKKWVPLWKKILSQYLSIEEVAGHTDRMWDLLTQLTLSYRQNWGPWRKQGWLLSQYLFVATPRKLGLEMEPLVSLVSTLAEHLLASNRDLERPHARSVHVIVERQARASGQRNRYAHLGVVSCPSRTWCLNVGVMPWTVVEAKPVH